MAVNSATVQNILKHAKAAREVWHDFLLIVPEKDKQAFKEAFHLRPTSAGITIVSTLPLAPMRGIDVSLADLKNSIKELFLNFKKFVADNEDTALDELKKFGFKKRTNKNSLEEDIQAKIINNMIRCTEQDDCFHFVASELTIEKGRRFDIVALRGDTLYIIEVKKIRTMRVDDQLKDYLAHFEAEMEHFQKLLKYYPGVGAPLSFKNVKGLAIMPYARNMNRNNWVDTAKIEHWFYEDSLHFKTLAEL